MLQAIAFGVRGVFAPASAATALDTEFAAERSRSVLGRLHGSLELALLDDGDEDELQAIVTGLGIQDRVSLQVWTHRLGSGARPPRPLAFRWLSNRWGLRPADCLYVPGRRDLATAAQRAGWCVVPGCGALELDTLVDQLEAGARPWEI